MLGVGGAEIITRLPVEFRYEGNIFSGEKRAELHVVPRFAVRLAPQIAIIPRPTREIVADRGAPDSHVHVHREVRVTVTNGVRGPAAGEVKLELPVGGDRCPIRRRCASRARTRRRRCALPWICRLRRHLGRPHAGDGESRRRVVRCGVSGDRLPHIRRRHVLQEAAGAMKIVDVQARPNLRVGYVMGVGDQVPQAIEQLGVRLEMIDAEHLAWGDLASYDAIVVGVRAYERREDLRAHNDRLLEYARGGGVVIVQDNKFEFNEAQYGPYPANVSSNRVTDENAPVSVLVPDHPAFRFPNRLGEAAWRGWVQERGLYFLGEKDPQYVDLLELSDPFENNRGPKRGALVEARIGRGRWLYVGLGLWRQLPAGTDGAYQLLANLLSLGDPTRLTPPRAQ